jgi:hypothetical protein
MRPGKISVLDSKAHVESAANQSYFLARKSLDDINDLRLLPRPQQLFPTDSTLQRWFLGFIG